MDSTLQWLRAVCAATAHLLFNLYFCIFVCFYWFMLHKSIKKHKFLCYTNIGGDLGMSINVSQYVYI